MFKKKPYNRHTVCRHCGQRIYFMKNSSGKWVPFNVEDNRCHYESCVINHETGMNHQSRPFQKRNIKCSEVIKNKKLGDFA